MASTTVTTKTVVIASRASLVGDRFQCALESGGHRAVPVTTADELASHVRKGFDADLLVLDLRLDASSGIDLVRSVSAHGRRRPPILILSGTIVSAQEVRELASLGIAGYINEHSATEQILPSLVPYLFPDSFNRRNGPRAALSVPLQYQFALTIVAALTLDVGHGGVAIRTTHPGDVGAKIKVRFRMAGADRDIDADGRVAWADRRVGMGVQFETVPVEGQALIDDFIDAQFFASRKT